MRGCFNRILIRTCRGNLTPLNEDSEINSRFSGIMSKFNFYWLYGTGRLSAIRVIIKRFYFYLLLMDLWTNYYIGQILPKSAEPDTMTTSVI